VNWIHDGRVSPGRIEDFLLFFDDHRRRTGVDDLAAAADAYRADVIWADPESYRSRANSANIALLPEDYRLIHVEDLTLRAAAFRSAKAAGHEAFGDFSTSLNLSAEGVNRFLEQDLGLGAEPAPGAIDAIVGALNLDPRGPVWTADAAELMKCLGGDQPECWCESVGIERDADHWMIVLEYSVADFVEGSLGDAVLLRPTQLEAGWSGFHFPSPPWLEPNEGGRILSLRSPDQTMDGERWLVPEFIHGPMLLRSDHVRAWWKTGTATRRRDLIGDLRQRHHNWLCEQYRGVPGWMASPG
jgi:hypothetical protein